MIVASWVLTIGAGYLIFGMVFAVAFVFIGVAVVDHAARGSRWTFRLLILPGVVALWPLMLSRWIHTRSNE